MPNYTEKKIAKKLCLHRLNLLKHQRKKKNWKRLNKKMTNVNHLNVSSVQGKESRKKKNESAMDKNSFGSQSREV